LRQTSDIDEAGTPVRSPWRFFIPHAAAGPKSQVLWTKCVVNGIAIINNYEPALSSLGTAIYAGRVGWRHLEAWLTYYTPEHIETIRRGGVAQWSSMPWALNIPPAFHAPRFRIEKVVHPAFIALSASHASGRAPAIPLAGRASVRFYPLFWLRTFCRYFSISCPDF